MLSTSRTQRSAPAFLSYRGSALVVALLADKWTIPVLHALAAGTKRTGELTREVRGISQRMLTHTLRALEANGLIDRTTYAVVPPRVEYTLTELGRSLNEPLAILCRWTVRHGATLEHAAAAHAKR